MEAILGLQKLELYAPEMASHSWLSIACHGNGNSILSISC